MSMTTRSIGVKPTASNAASRSRRASGQIGGDGSSSISAGSPLRMRPYLRFTSATIRRNSQTTIGTGESAG